MRVLSRLTFVCVLVLLQLESASGHVFHHAFEGAVPEHRDCTDAACGGDQNTAASCHHGSDTDPPPQHDCNNCFFCDASDAEVAQTTQQQRPLIEAAAAYPVTSAAESDASGDPAHRLPAGHPPPRPATLHAVTLPLLD